MQKVNIYAHGSYYTDKAGVYEYWLECNGKVVYGNGVEPSATSAVQLAVYGVASAVNRITKPCEVTICTSGPIGFANIKKSKNKEILESILKTCRDKGVVLSYNVKADLKPMYRWNRLNGVMRPYSGGDSYSEWDKARYESGMYIEKL